MRSTAFFASVLNTILRASFSLRFFCSDKRLEFAKVSDMPTFVHAFDRVTKQAVKALAAMPSTARELVKSKFQTLAADPTSAANGKKLVGRPGYWLRVGGWHVIYTLDSGRLVILVLEIGARGGVYK